VKLRLTERVPDRSSALAEPALEAGGEGDSAPVEGCVCGAGLIRRSGSAAFAFGMMDHLSLKFCAAAAFTCNPIHTDTTAIAILEAPRMIASHNLTMQINNRALRRFPLLKVFEMLPHRRKARKRAPDAMHWADLGLGRIGRSVWEATGGTSITESRRT
jgi:hypothetical protein